MSRLEIGSDGPLFRARPRARTPPGLSGDVVRGVSDRKHEQEWMTERRVEAYRYWLTMEESD